MVSAVAAFAACNNLQTVYYTGTRDQWDSLLKQGGNEVLNNADIICHEHSWGENTITKYPECGIDGQSQQVCTGCGAINIESIPATGHLWGDWEVTLEVTCTTNGSEKRHCPHCNIYETRSIPATGHDLGDEYEYWSPTCTEKGELCRDCNNCNYVETREIPAIGHDLGEWYTAKEPKDLEDGQERRDCQRKGCGYYEVRAIESLAKRFNFDLLGNGTYSVSGKGDLKGSINIPSSNPYNGIAVTEIAKRGFGESQ